MDNLSKSRIREIQGLLNKLGYYNYIIDGIIGNYTIEAIKKFQKNNNILGTGEIDEETLNRIDQYIMGYISYTIQPGDTLYDIANAFKTKVWRIIAANPGIDPFTLEVGKLVVIPLNYGIVPTDIPYTYDIMKHNIVALNKRYPMMNYDSIGKSVDGRQLYHITIGKGSNHVIYNASHHANEWITSPLLMKWLENFLETYVRRGSIRGYSTEDIWNKATIHVVPMVNPDGVDLVIDGVSEYGMRAEQLIAWNYGNEDFSDWKANIRGVDLNRNYDAGWYEYKDLELEFGIDGPGPRLYAGSAPESEPESYAMANLTRDVVTRLVLAYHTQGQVIFWQYKDLQPEVSVIIGDAFAKASGYELASEALSQSLAGYKDWYIKAFRKPGYTIEVGLGENPLPLDQFDMIYENNEELLLLGSII